MFTSVRHNRIEITDLQVPAKTISENEANTVKGGNPFTLVVGAFTVGWKIGTYLDKQFQIGKTVFGV